MALDTYTNLKTAVADWLNRSDLTSAIPDFITLAEAQMRRDLKQYLTSSFTKAAAAADLDVDATATYEVAEVLGVAMNDGAGGTYNHPLLPIDRDTYQQLMSNDSTVRAPTRFYFVDRDQDSQTTTLRFYPPLSATNTINIRVAVVKQLQALASAAGGVNAVLTLAPDAYLFGTLLQAAKYLEHDSRVPMWKDDYASAIKGLRIQGDRQQYGGTPRYRRLPRVMGP